MYFTWGLRYHNTSMGSAHATHIYISLKKCKTHTAYIHAMSMSSALLLSLEKGNRTCRWWNHFSRVHSSGQGLQYKHSRIVWVKHTYLHTHCHRVFWSQGSTFPWLRSEWATAGTKISQSPVFHLISYGKLLEYKCTTLLILILN